MWAASYGNVSSGICRQRRPMSACASTQSHQDLYCLLTVSLHTTHNVWMESKYLDDTLRMYRIIWICVFCTCFKALFRITRPTCTLTHKQYLKGMYKILAGVNSAKDICRHFEKGSNLKENNLLPLGANSSLWSRPVLRRRLVCTKTKL